MKKLLLGLAALPFVAGVAMAGEPAPLSDSQMDQVTAGVVVVFTFQAGGSGNFTINGTTFEGTSPNLGPPNTRVTTSSPSLDGREKPGLPITVVAAQNAPPITP